MRPDGEAGPSRGAINIEARTYGESYFTSTAESSKFRQVRRLWHKQIMPVQLVSIAALCDAANCALLGACSTLLRKTASKLLCLATCRAL